jgi:hypothetical protein
LGYASRGSRTLAIDRRPVGPVRSAILGETSISAPKDSPWGRRAVVADSDGHRVELTGRSRSSDAAGSNVDFGMQFFATAILRSERIGRVGGFLRNPHWCIATTSTE